MEQKMDNEMETGAMQGFKELSFKSLSWANPAIGDIYIYFYPSW